MSARGRNRFIESIARAQNEQGQAMAANIESVDAARQVLPCTLSVGSSADIAPFIRKKVGVCILAYDFTDACNWPVTQRMGFCRSRVEAVSSGMPLFEIQAAMRHLQSTLENECQTFCAMMNELEACLRNNRDEIGLLDEFLAAFARTIGKGVDELMDGHGGGHSKFVFQGEQSLWHMDEFCKQMVDDLDTTFGEVAHDDLGIESLNLCIAWLCILGFLSSSHYSVMRRTRYTSIFKKLFVLARILSNDDIHPKLAGYIFAAAQADEAKQALVLKKCIPSNESPAFNIFPIVSFQQRVGILRVVRRYRASYPDQQDQLFVCTDEPPPSKESLTKKD